MDPYRPGIDGPDRRRHRMLPDWRWLISATLLVLSLAVFRTVDGNIKARDAAEARARDLTTAAETNRALIDSLNARVAQLEKTLRQAGVPVPAAPSSSPPASGSQSRPAPSTQPGVSPTPAPSPSPSRSPRPSPSRPPRPTSTSPSPTCLIPSAPVCL